MANIEKIVPGQILHDYHRQRNVFRTMGHWEVTVKEVDLERRKALCSWNGNPPRWYRESEIKKLKVKERGED